MKNINTLIISLLISFAGFSQGTIKVNVKGDATEGYLLNGQPFSGGSSTDTVVISNVDTIYIGGGNGNDTIWVCDSAGAIHNNGANVGIGTTNPTEILGLTSTGGSRARIQIQNDSTTNGGLLMGLNKNGAAVFRLKEDKAMRFYAGDTESMTLTKGGNLNLGNTNTSDATKIKIVNTSTVNGGLLMGLNANGHAELRQKEDKELRFYTNNTEAMRIKKDGRIGIGTNNPETTFEVKGTAKVSDYMKIGENSMYLQATPGTVTENHIYGGLGTNGIGEDVYLQALTRDGSTEISDPTKFGNVGIGTTEPKAKLDVAGDIIASEYQMRYISGVGTFNQKTVVSSNGQTNLKVGIDAGTYMNGGQNGDLVNNALFGYCAGRFGTRTDGVIPGGVTLPSPSSMFFNRNTMAGSLTGSELRHGQQNTFLGYGAGLNAVISSNNIFIGHYAGAFTTPGGATGNNNQPGNNNVYIGTLASGNSNIYNSTAIGFQAHVSAPNSMVLGNNVNVGIGSSAPAAKLDVNGNIVTNEKIGIGTNVPGGDLHISGSNDKILRLTSTTQGSEICLKAISSNGRKSAQVQYTGELSFFDTDANVNTMKIGTNGIVYAEEFKVKLYSDGWPDYVFDKKYDLMPLAELDVYVTKNKHLPNVPSQKDVEKTGDIGLGEMNRILLEKVEELTRYIIEQDKRLIQLETQSK